MKEPIQAGTIAELDTAGRASPNQFVVELQQRFADYLRARAAAHGEDPNQHLARIVREFWANHDEWRRTQIGGLSRPGGAGIAA